MKVLTPLCKLHASLLLPLGLRTASTRLVTRIGSSNRPRQILSNNAVAMLPSALPQRRISALCRAAAVDGSDAAAGGAGAAAAVEDARLDQALEIRVGRIIKAWKHPEADNLYVEEVDLGESTGPRTICSGLVQYVGLEELQGRPVLVLANLKPRNMKGVKSNGMLLAASDAAHERVELLNPPEGAIPGERAWFGEVGEGDKLPAAATPNQLQKKKIWETVQPELKTTEELVATFRGLPLRTAIGVVKSTSLAEARIS